MSGHEKTIPCPLCDKAVSLSYENGEQSHFNYILWNNHTREEQFTCVECGFGWSNKIEQYKGRHFWVETVHYPMDDKGNVLRPPKPPTAVGVKKDKVDDTPRTASMNVANLILF